MHELILKTLINTVLVATVFLHKTTSTRKLGVASFPSYDSRFAKYSFVSPEKIKALVEFEWSVYTRIKPLYDSYSINQTRNKAKSNDTFCSNSGTRVKMYLDDFQKSILKSLTRAGFSSDEPRQIFENFPWNPILVYKVTSLFLDYSFVWAGTKSSKDEANDELMMKISSALSEVSFPEEISNKDLNRAVYGIWSLQSDFNLTVHDISSGFVNGIDTSVILNVKDCYRIGKYSVSVKHITIGIQWLQYALYLVQNSTDDSIALEEVEDAIDVAQVLENYLDLKQWRVCNGVAQQKEQEKSNLFCWYEGEIHPSYKIGPIKAEFYSRFPKPEVVQYHDIINDDIVDFIINFAILQSEVKIRGVDFENERFGGRLYYEERVAQKLLRIIMRLTGLETLNDEVEFPLSIFLYLPGTDKNRHLDRGNDAMATIMFYITDVEKGGETAFATTGVKVTPRRRSAILWYNRFTDGTLDKSTDHGSCHVIFGEKWVVLNHISFHDQHHLQCDLKPRTRFKTLVNGRLR